MRTFKPSKLSIALLSCGFMMSSGMIYAQEAVETTSEPEKVGVKDNAEEKIEVIEVTGFRRSLIQSINEKRFADTVSEQLTADESKLGKEIPYGNQPAGYALTPADTINYVSKHDNQSLWDNNQYRIAYHLDTHQRIRMQLQSLSFVLFAQGIPFIHMGSELLRSKGFLRDSYDYGDWFNKVDFSKQNNNYNIGLPPADKDQQNWQMISDVLTKNAGKDFVTSADIDYSSAVFIDLVKIRMSSPLFRLTTAEDIINKVKFHNTGSKQKIGVFAMSIEGDEKIPTLMVIFNTSADKQLVQYDNAQHFQLHPVQQNGSDAEVKESKVEDNHFIMPALTTAIFIKSKT